MLCMCPRHAVDNLYNLLNNRYETRRKSKIVKHRRPAHAALRMWAGDGGGTQHAQSPGVCVLGAIWELKVRVSGR